MISPAVLAVYEQTRADVERLYVQVQPVMELIQRQCQALPQALLLESLATAAHLQPLIDDILARKPSEVYLHVHK